VLGELLGRDADTIESLRAAARTLSGRPALSVVA